ncbi:MAG: ribonuclease domain-containing protein [Christensenella sp.]|nr:ribonuclease domain-containing protein [Christensenella sp.]
MKKRTIAIIIVVLAVLGSLWLSRQQAAPVESTVLPQQTGGGLVSLDEAAGSMPQATEEAAATQNQEPTAKPEQTAIDEDGIYSSKADVSLYLHTFGHLPQNFITKSEARALGWNGGGLDDYDYGKCIGGDRFGNNEGLLPETGGRDYFECDIDTMHRDSRGAKRIVFSDDGLIYYTDDHYESFTLLYGEP